MSDLMCIGLSSSSHLKKWGERVQFGTWDDVADAPPSVALPMLERGITELLERLVSPR